MCAEDARRVVRQCIKDDGRLTVEDVARVLKASRRRWVRAPWCRWNWNHPVERRGGIAASQEVADATAGAVPRRRGEHGSRYAKGVLLLGVQGGGKSLAAKSVAGTWHVPLLRLDFSTLYKSGWARRAQSARGAQVRRCMAPCVLWMDEIEKGIATVRATAASRGACWVPCSHGWQSASRSLHGGDANDIEQLPPELVRKGASMRSFSSICPASRRAPRSSGST